jgi:hypothetical protein
MSADDKLGGSLKTEKEKMSIATPNLRPKKKKQGLL